MTLTEKIQLAHVIDSMMCVEPYGDDRWTLFTARTFSETNDKENVYDATYILGTEITRIMDLLFRKDYRIQGSDLLDDGSFKAEEGYISFWTDLPYDEWEKLTEHYKTKLKDYNYTLINLDDEDDNTQRTQAEMEWAETD